MGLAFGLIWDHNDPSTQCRPPATRSIDHDELGWIQNPQLRSTDLSRIFFLIILPVFPSMIPAWISLLALARGLLRSARIWVHYASLWIDSGKYNTSKIVSVWVSRSLIPDVSNLLTLLHNSVLTQVSTRKHIKSPWNGMFYPQHSW